MAVAERPEAKMTPEQVDKLVTFGKMAIEQGWYDQAREHFEQALNLDASNRKAMKGLARVNEILSRRAAFEPIKPEAPPAKPASKVHLVAEWVRKKHRAYAEWLRKKQRERAERAAERERIAAKRRRRAEELEEERRRAREKREAEQRWLAGPGGYWEGQAMKYKYVAFDIEIARVLPEGEGDWKAYRPLGITCAAVLRSDDEEPLLFHGLTGDRRPADQMSRQDAVNLVHCLLTMISDGYAILTWNGLGFDFDILAEESQMFEECSWLALNHVDMMFHVFCELGHPIALDRAAKAMGLAGKPKGLSGALAPRLWATGKRQEVLDYVAQDARTTLELAQTCEEHGYLRWIAHSGNMRTMALPTGWLTVREAITLPEPDTSWMSNPWPRTKFTNWIINPQEWVDKRRWEQERRAAERGRLAAERGRYEAEEWRPEEWYWASVGDYRDGDELPDPTVCGALPDDDDMFDDDMFDDFF